MRILLTLLLGITRAFYWEDRNYTEVTLSLFNGKFKGREVEFSDGKKVQIFRGQSQFL